MPKVKNGKTGKRKQADRPVKYPEVVVSVCSASKQGPITAEDAKALLGWQEVERDYLLIDGEGKKIACTCNISNRPIYQSILATLKQEILNRRWRLNGEPIIIGKTGLVLNGQHSLIALILAEQERIGPNKHHWEALWGADQVTMEKIVVHGIDEEDAVVNTMDTCKPRTLADVIYRSPYFAGESKDSRLALARMTDYAIRTVWHRAGFGVERLNAFAPRRTHAESLDFLARHGRLLEAVKVISELDRKDRHISLYLSPGYAAGWLYLMGSSASGLDAYRSADPPREAVLTWERWELACDLWKELAEGASWGVHVRAALAGLVQGERKPSLKERVAVFAKTWSLLLEQRPVMVEQISLGLGDYTRDSHGMPCLLENWNFGGIDMGDPHEYIDPHELESRAQEEVRRRERNRREASQLHEKLKDAREAKARAAQRKLEFGPDGKPPPPRLVCVDANGQLKEEEA